MIFCILLCNIDIFYSQRTLQLLKLNTHPCQMCMKRAAAVVQYLRSQQHHDDGQLLEIGTWQKSFGHHKKVLDDKENIPMYAWYKLLLDASRVQVLMRGLHTKMDKCENCLQVISIIK